MEARKNNPLRRLIFAAICLALALVLPRLTGGNPQLGMALSPMHFPALLCGFICGWSYALVVGALSPILNSLLFGMPPIYPIATAMALELAVYGLMTALLYKLFPKKPAHIYISLIIAMIAGRVVGCAATCLFTGKALAAVIPAYFVTTLWGVAVQIVLIPPIVMALKKAGYILND